MGKIKKLIMALIIIMFVIILFIIILNVIPTNNEQQEIDNPNSNEEIEEIRIYRNR